METLKLITFLLDSPQSIHHPILLWADSADGALNLLRQACEGRNGWTVEVKQDLDLMGVPSNGDGLLVFTGLGRLTEQDQIEVLSLIFDRAIKGTKLPEGFRVVFLCNPHGDSPNYLDLDQGALRRCIHLSVDPAMPELAACSCK